MSRYDKSLFDPVLLCAPLAQSFLSPYIDALIDSLRATNPKPHGNETHWEHVWQQLPDTLAQDIDIAAQVSIGAADELPAPDRDRLKQLLQQLMPWRKGPFHLFGIDIDSEWRSDMKWARIAPHIGDIAGKRVLDVGAGNGYYTARMLGMGAEFVLAVEPMRLYCLQFYIMQRYAKMNACMLPLRLETLPDAMLKHQDGLFDYVFSMGVLYHRKSALAHLRELLDCTKKDGQLVLETLIVDDQYGPLLMIDDRYAKMRNVYYIPTVARLLDDMDQSGWSDLEVIDISTTSVEEQRKTEWIASQSLVDFLDPHDLTKTIEGHPAPKRVFVKARKPS